MKPRVSVSVAVGSVIALLWGGPTWAGLTFETEGPQGHSTIRAEGKLLRVDRQGTEASASGPVVIIDGTTRIVTVVNTRAKSFMRMDLDRLEAMGAQGQSRMEQALSKLTPEQRKQVEASLKPDAGTGGGASAGTDIKLEPMGKKELVAGYTCEWHRAVRDGKPFAEVCHIPLTAIGLTRAELDPTLKTLESLRSVGARFGQSDPARPDWVKAPGFPAIRVTVSPSGERTEVERLARVKLGTVPADQFTVPVDYKQTAAPEQAPPTPGLHPARAAEEPRISMPAPLAFERAALLCYRLFDIADSIDLERGRALLAAPGIRRLRLSREGSEYLELPNPPLIAELGQRALQMKAGVVTVTVTARLYDHGAASILMEVPVAPGTLLDSVVPTVDELSDSPAVDALAEEVLRPLREALAPALDDAHLWSASESYTVVFAEKLAGDPTAAEILASPALAPLLLGDAQARNLSATERSDVLEQQFSYTDHDLAVMDWNGAFVYEPSGSRDIPDLLEIANAQLLELRYYDEVLDTQLRQTHAEMSLSRGRWYSILRSPYRKTARRLLLTLIELGEFIERVENSLKIIGDFYLAKVYEGALKQLRISAWQRSVTRKQQVLAQTYELLKGEIDTDRTLTLETMIVLLIVVELVVALWPAMR